MKAPSGLPLIYVALDTKDLGLAQDMTAALAEAGCGIKLGLEFFNRHGPQGVHDILQNRVRPSVFLDLKYHDIPNTVAGAVESVASLDVAFLNVHAAGGTEMMRAAKRSCAAGTRLLAVTVLTSLDDSALSDVGQTGPAVDQVTRLALLTEQAGLDGVVCSPQEIAVLRNKASSKLILMVPGIRPEGSDAGIRSAL